jgi:Spy/CpxP family protein refolding chaperone
MHPGIFGWRRGHGWGSEGSCGSRGSGHEGPPWGWHGAPFGGGDGHGAGGDEFGGGLGVRRPLRFLAFKLELDESQVTLLAAILDDLKTERAQAAVDHRRTTSSFADAVSAESFDEAKARAASDERVKSTERVQSAVARALGRMHAVLKPEQRAKLAYLLRTGALTM